MLVQIRSLDQKLLAGIAEVMEEAKRTSGDWLVCRPGCAQCCIGPFAITQLDADRLRDGLASVDPAIAERVRARAAEYVELIAPQYPGDPSTGELYDDDSLPESMDVIPCPALNPENGLCELYDWRPVTCRCFGPVTRIADGVAACELCYRDASDEQMEACAVEIDPEGIECDLLARLAAEGRTGATIVAYALVAE